MDKMEASGGENIVNVQAPMGFLGILKKEGNVRLMGFQTNEN